MTHQIIDVTKLEKLRPLGSLEIYSSARHHLEFYQNVGISAFYTSPSLTSQTLKSTIFSALAIVIEQHPILSAIVVNEDSNDPYFARLPSINLEDTVTFVTRQLPFDENERDVELDSMLSEQHNTGFKESYGELPFWRVIVTTTPGIEGEFVASYIYHHALGDGTSGVVLHKSFFQALQNQPAPLASMTFVPTRQELLPTLEQAAPFAKPPTTAPYVPKELWAGNKVALPTRTVFHSLVLPALTSHNFLQACRDECTTLTATLPVIIAVALNRALTPSTPFSELECTTPVSLRRFLSSPINEHVMGIWLDAFSQYYRREDVAEFSWDEARRSRAKIVECLKNDGREVNILNLMTVPDMRQYFRDKVGKERMSSFNVSNLGSMKLLPTEAKSDWEMGRMNFSRSAMVTGSAIDVGVITGPDGCIAIGFCWQEGVVSEELVEAVKKGVEIGVQSVAGMI